MSIICDADFAYLKPGKKVILKSFQGLLIAPDDASVSSAYWQLIGKKATVVNIESTEALVYPGKGRRALLRFDENIKNMGIECDNEIENSLWIFIADLKFVCRY